MGVISLSVTVFGRVPAYFSRGHARTKADSEYVAEWQALLV